MTATRTMSEALALLLSRLENVRQIGPNTWVADCPHCAAKAETLVEDDAPDDSGVIQ